MTKPPTHDPRKYQYYLGRGLDRTCNGEFLAANHAEKIVPSADPTLTASENSYHARQEQTVDLNLYLRMTCLFHLWLVNVTVSLRTWASNSATFARFRLDLRLSLKHLIRIQLISNARKAFR